MERCHECGFEYRVSSAPAAGPAIVAYAGELAGLLAATADTGADLRTRRSPEIWSPLEYACHVRDVLLVQRERILLARRVDRPTFEPMGRDERVEHDGYAAQHPVDVARQLGDAARLFANVLSRLDAADSDRTCMFTYPEVTERSLRWVAVHTVHELRHHLADVRRQLTREPR